MAHTPGPWFVSGQPILSVTAREGYPTIAQVTALYWNRNDDGDEIEANAHLIAAAPDLLEALERVMSDDEVALSRPDFAFAQAAIAKARSHD